MIDLTVLMSEIACAPERTTASPGSVMSPMLGVSLMMTGVLAVSTAQRAISSRTLGSLPTAEPIPRSHMPCGQPKLSSSPSAPASSARRMISRHSSRVSTISEAMTACLGYRRLTSRISRKFTSKGRSVMSSMLLRPARRVLP